MVIEERRFSLTLCSGVFLMDFAKFLCHNRSYILMVGDSQLLSCNLKY